MPAEKDIFEVKLNPGDARAFASLFHLYYRQLVLFANRYMNDLRESEEIVSDVFTVLWERGHEIEFRTSVKSYLFKAVHNRCLNVIRHRKIENLYVEYLAKNALFEQNRQLFENRQSERETAARISEAMNMLPEKCREIFRLSRFEHLKYQEIADKLQLSPKTVERQISIALEKMRRFLKGLSCLML